MQPVIRIANVSKSYRLGQKVNGERTLRDALSRVAGRLSLRGRGSVAMPDAGSTLQALSDISMEVNPGEVVGFVGHNGAGKSTLLKVLAGITTPTKGRVEIRGRVASLLEVGTGFHPELSGRENIYLNGTILGMSSREIRANFDDIVAFSGVERFLETPVKRYSSGMRVRLAFAVAAHLDPEVLIVDEVLAVGDAAFQAKCLGKMKELAGGHGRTVLFVSHSMPSVRTLCSRAVYMERGRVLADGDPEEVIAQYRTGLERVNTRPLQQQIDEAPQDPAFQVEAVEMAQPGEMPGHYVTGKPVNVRVTYRVAEPTQGLRVELMVHDNDGTLLFRTICGYEQNELLTFEPGRYTSEVTLPADLLAPIQYDLGVSASIYNGRQCLPQPITSRIQVHDEGRIKLGYGMGPVDLKLAPYLPWTTHQHDTGVGACAA